MTWWEVEQIALYLKEIESGLDTWKFSNPKMRRENDRMTQCAEKIDKELPTINDVEKKDFLIHLADRIGELQEYLTERLKREVSKPVSPRNLLS